jgi:hypothetical protein
MDVIVAYFKLISLHLQEYSEENYDNPLLGLSMSHLKFELGIITAPVNFIGAYALTG